MTNEDKALIDQIVEAKLKQYGLISEPIVEPKEVNQQKEVLKWQEGEWAWADKSKTTLGIVTKIYGQFANINTQTEKLHTFTGLWHEDFIKPTPEEVEAHLVEIAKKKYPVGATFKNLYSDVRQVVANHTYTNYKDGELRVNGGTVWHNGQWATILNEVEQERWKPHKGEDYWLVLGNCNVEQTTHDFWNEKYVEVGNCFKTEQEAQEKANQIKELLSKK